MTSNLISQNVISNINLRSQNATFKNKVGRKYLPYVFTEQGVAMLSGVLKSDVAVRISIQIMSEFIALRKVIQTNSMIFSRLDDIEQKQIVNKIDTDKKFDQVFDALSDPNVVPKQKCFLMDRLLMLTNLFPILFVWQNQKLYQLIILLMIRFYHYS